MVATLLTPRGSGDVYMYAMFGSVLGNHHENPYTHAPRNFPDDPLLEPTVGGWRHVRSPYGPAFTVLSAGVAKVAADTPMLAVRIFQSLDSVLILGVAALLFRRTRDHRVALFVVLNPALAAIANGGHNDIIPAALITVGLLTSTRWKAVCFTLAIAVKLTAILPVAVILLWLLINRHPRAVALSASVAALTLLSFAAFGIGNVLSSLGDSDMTTSRASLWSLPNHLGGNVGMFATIGAAALACVGAFTRPALRSNSPLLAAALAALIELFLYPYVLPWYAAPALLIAAATTDKRLMTAAFMPSAALLIAYVVPPGEPISGLLGVLSATALPIAAAATIVIALTHPRQTTSRALFMN